MDFRKCQTSDASPAKPGDLHLILGVPNILVMDPDHKRMYVFANNALQLSQTCVLHLPKIGVDLPFPADQLFAELD